MVDNLLSRIEELKRRKGAVILAHYYTLAEVQAAYEKAIPRINACADEMTDRRVALMRDSALLDRLYERNEGLYRELC